MDEIPEELMSNHTDLIDFAEKFASRHYTFVADLDAQRKYGYPHLLFQKHELSTAKKLCTKQKKYLNFLITQYSEIISSNEHEDDTEYAKNFPGLIRFYTQITEVECWIKIVDTMLKRFTP